MYFSFMLKFIPRDNNTHINFDSRHVVDGYVHVQTLVNGVVELDAVFVPRDVDGAGSFCAVLLVPAVQISDIVAELEPRHVDTPDSQSPDP